MFTKIDLERESLDINFVHPYPFFFETGEKNAFFKEYFDSIKSHGNQ
jgi:hypothetical protein